MERQRLVQMSDEFQKMIDFFLRDEFSDLVADDQFFELFLRYFRNEIIGNSFVGKRFLLRPSEKSLQYVKPDAVESAVEYEFLVRRQPTAVGKVHYAKKGGDFCVVLPVLDQRRDKELHQRLAALFYRQAARYSEAELNRELFDFLGGITHEMMMGLTHVIAGIRSDGHLTLERAYEELVQRYAASSDAEPSRELARALIRFGRMLEIPDDDIPLRQEHYGMLFVVP